MKSMTAKTYLSAWRGFNKFLLCLDYKPEHWELPAHINLLEILTFEFERMFKTQHYLEILYKTIFLIGYYGLLRIGEMTMSPHTLKAKNVHIGVNKDKILLILYSSKTHGANNFPQKIKIQANVNCYYNTFKKKHFFCPFEVTCTFIWIRGGYKEENENFFIFHDQSPVCHHHFQKVMKDLIRRCNLEESLYGTHSLRIGRCSDLIRYGFPIDVV